MNVAISIFTESFADYAIQMYKSFRLFDQTTHLIAGSIDLNRSTIDRLKRMDIEVRHSKTQVFPKHLCMCDLTMLDYLDGVKWDHIMWIDADTVLLRPVSHLFEMPYDYIGHPADIVSGEFTFPSPLRSPLTRRSVDGVLVETDRWGYHYDMGLWVTDSYSLLKDFYDLLQCNINAWYEGDICSQLINMSYSNYQLDGYKWSLGSQHGSLLKFNNGKVTYDYDGHTFEPYQFGFSRTTTGERLSNPAIESFIAWHRIGPRNEHVCNIAYQ